LRKTKKTKTCLVTCFFKAFSRDPIRSLEFQIGSLESEKTIIGSIESEKLGPYRSKPGF